MSSQDKKDEFYGGEDLLDIADREEERKKNIEAYGSETPLLKKPDEVPSLAERPEEVVKTEGTAAQEVTEESSQEESTQTKYSKEEVDEWLRSLEEDREERDALYGRKK